MFMLTILSKIHPACHSDANGIKPGSNSNMTDKHAADCSKAAYLCINESVCNVFIVHTTI